MKNYFPFLSMEDYDKIVKNISVADRKLNENYFLHAHKYCEFEIFLDGTGTQILNNVASPLRRGAIAFLTPTDVHEIIVEKPLHNHNISFELNSIQSELIYQLLDTEKKVFYPSKENFQRLTTLSTLIIDAFNNINIVGEEYLVALLSVFITLFIKINNTVTTSNLTTPIQNAIIHIHKNFNNKLTLAEVASLVHLSSNYFSELFSQEVGMTFSQYLKKVRIENAKKLLASTDHTVTDVCFECGYTSLSNFLRAFKSTVFMSPLHYRNLYKKAMKRSQSKK